ncbi:MAG: hypothetical protein LBU87_07120 [Lactobacillales bacterium]|jgi:hypothetical protein|nr:hypothetical protein [Lactobacillales bacterium]
MNSKTLMLNLYKKLYGQRHLLSGAPELTLDPDGVGNFDYAAAAREIDRLVSYLLGVKNALDLSFDKTMEIIVNGYNDQPFWKNALLDWVDLGHAQKMEDLKHQGKSIKEKMQDVIMQADIQKQLMNELSDRLSQKIKDAGFHIDGKKLFKNYVRMYLDDPKKANDILKSQPAFFAPIQTVEKDGTRVLTKEEALQENKDLAAFLKKIKI